MGWADVSIGDVLACAPAFVGDAAVALTRLDSGPAATPWVLDTLSEHAVEYRKTAAGVVISGKHVLKALRDTPVLTHFDEVYIFEEVPSDFAVDRHFTTDGVDFGIEVPEAFLDTVRRYGVRRFLADGCGLNFMCESESMVEEIARIERELTDPGQAK